MKKLKRWCYFILIRCFRSDKIKTQNGRIYSRKAIEKQFKEFATRDKSFGELSHPQPDIVVCTHRFKN